MITGRSHPMIARRTHAALPSAILEPLWVQFAALLPSRQVHHPLGCHRRRLPDRVIFDKLIQVLVFGCGYRRIADQACSATTLRRRRDEWITLGLAERLRLGGAWRLRPAVRPGTRATGGGQLHHQGTLRRPDRRAQPGGPAQAGAQALHGHRGARHPLGAVAAAANRRDDGLLAATLDTLVVVGVPPAQPVVHLDAGYDYQPCRQALTRRRMLGEIATRGVPAPIQAGRRWPVERTHAWGNHGRQAALVHRASPAGGGVLAGAGQRRHRLWPAAPPGLDLLPLGRPSPPPPLTAYWRSL